MRPCPPKKDGGAHRTMPSRNPGGCCMNSMEDSRRRRYRYVHSSACNSQTIEACFRCGHCCSRSAGSAGNYPPTHTDKCFLELDRDERCSLACPETERCC